MKIEKNISLKEYNTFQIDVLSNFFVKIKKVDDLIDLLKTDVFQKNNRFILGGGSNILFTDNFDGLTIKNEILGINIISEDNEKAILRIGGGEGWPHFVDFCVENGYWGVENLACIPGSVGAAPVQNIGAYGVEAKDIIKTVHFVDMETGNEEILQNLECEFGYRESIFKKDLLNKAFITYVDFELSKTEKLNTSYGGVSEKLLEKGIKKPNLKDVKDIICEIRSEKLPNPKIVGSAGSFFKNPIISLEEFKSVQEQNTDIPHFETENGNAKIPAGWLIEQCGWKGKRVKNIGVWDKHALVIVNYGESKPEEILNLVRDIKDSVRDRFGILLEEEVLLV